MTILTTVVSFVGVLVVLIIAHELGHFVTAKASGVRVDEFGLGFPPRLYGIKKGETMYSLNALPFGGFVKMAGEEDPSGPGSLASKPFGIRLMVLSAGSLMNVLLPFLLLSIAFMVPHNVATGQVVVDDVVPNSPAISAGIEPGDTLISINDRPIHNIGDVHRNILTNLGEPINILVKHSDSTTENIQVIPRWRPPEGEGAIGIAVRSVNPTVVRQSEPFWRAIPLGASEFLETMVLFKNGILLMIVGTAPATAIVGPVGIAQMTGERGLRWMWWRTSRMPTPVRWSLML
ncbi:RIP metalloprotease [Chloroflexota bacterium]